MAKANAQLAKPKQSKLSIYKILAREVEGKLDLPDSGTPPTRREDTEKTAGCNPNLGQVAEGDTQRTDLPLFFADSTAYTNWEPERIYERASEDLLGDKIEATGGAPAPVTTALCFNCGEPDHAVSGCPYPINRELVALSRQLHNHLKTVRGVMDFQRIHEVESWRQQRLEWLDAFQPGEIRGPSLQEALVDTHDSWLANMALWGYPKGWYRVEDPRQEIKSLIWDEYCGEEGDISIPFQIYGDEGDVEIIALGTERTEDAECETSSSSSYKISRLQPVRWATYPNRHFSSERLPVYNGFMLPPIASNNGSTTYTLERHELWQHITSSDAPAFAPQPLPGSQPPAPTVIPPPLPPQPPELASYNVELYDEVDMEISDSDGQ